MSNTRAEQAEHIAHKSADYHSEHAGKTMSHEAHDAMRSQLRHVTKSQEQHDPILVMGDIFNQIKHGVDRAIDSDKTARFIKHDICNDDPVKEAALGVAVAGTAVVGTVLFAPEAILASGLTATAAGATAILGTFAAGGLAMDYDQRHPKKAN